MTDASDTARVFVHFTVSNLPCPGGHCHNQTDWHTHCFCRDSKEPVYRQRYNQLAAAQPHDEL